MFVKVEDRDSIIRHLRDLIHNLRQVVPNNAKSLTALHLGGNVSTTARPVSTLYDLYKDAEGLSAIMIGMILETAHRAEIESGGSSDLLVRTVLDSLNEISRSSNTDDAYESLKSDLDLVSSLISKRTRKCDLELVSDCIHGVIADKTIADMIISSFSLAGIEGRIMIDKNPALEPSVEITHGYVFDNLIMPIGPFSGEKKWERDWPRCFAIDGIIEQVSEIHKILDGASSSEDPVVIFARGFKEEVLSTIQYNRDRGTIDVLPIMINFDVSAINTIVDIATVCDAYLFSSNKGDVVSSIDFAEGIKVEKISCNSDSLTVINPDVRQKVELHIGRLREKISKEGPEVENLINKRLRSLTSICCNIKLSPRSEQERKYLHEEIDLGLRLMSSLTSNGIIIVEELIEDLSSRSGGILLNSIRDNISRSMRRTMPAKTIETVARLSRSLLTSIISLEKAVVLDGGKDARS